MTDEHKAQKYDVNQKIEMKDPCPGTAQPCTEDSRSERVTGILALANTLYCMPNVNVVSYLHFLSA